MKKAVIVFIFLFLLSSVLICSVFGKELRDVLSPTVEIMYPVYAVYAPGESAYLSFSEEAVLSAGKQEYVYTIVSTDEYPEDAYTAVREDITVFYKNNGTVYVRFRSHEPQGAIAIRWSEELHDGQRVRIKEGD